MGPVENIFMKIFVFVLVQFLFLSVGFSQESIKDQHIRIRVLAPQIFSSEDETVMGLYFQPDPEWHVYWQNPGDSGAAPKFDFSSQTADIGPILWPFPARLPIAHLTNIGYEGSVVYLFSVKPKSTSDVEIKMNLEWLVCKIDCVPGFAKINFKQPVHSAASRWKAADLDLVKKFLARVPESADSAPLKISMAYLDQGHLKLKVKSASDLKTLQIFPLNGDFIHAATPEIDANGDEFIFKTTSVTAPAKLSFVAAYNNTAWQFNDIPLSLTGAVSAESLLSLIFFAILGGLILNLMPCVFPVISIKTFSLLKTKGKDRVKDCLLYSLGVMTTFVLLGGLFLFLRSFGAAVGWGFQLQSPAVILGLVLLFWLMALNFLGAFEMGTSIMNFSGQLKGGSSSFGTGVLSVFVAAPCTGPFMGAALGAAITLPALSALIIFLGLGFGLALPFILFAFFPRLLTVLPKPGPWMEMLKQFFAFPLFATVLWLLWVLGQQAHTHGWYLASIAIFVVSLAIWLSKYLSSQKNIILALVTLIVVGGLAYSLNLLGSPTSSQITSNWQAYDEAKLKEARQNGQAVFVDFTAAWCITCQVNKQAVLDTVEAQNYFKENNILLMRADWTRYDPKITAALSKLGRSSVPVYAYYPRDGSEPKLLPQLLTLNILKGETQ